MKLVAVTRILNEADIAEAFVRHTAHYVDHHIFIDNGSTDGTLAILKALQDEGFGITAYHSSTVFFNESTSGTFLYERAVIDHGASWVLPIDTDEFIDDRPLQGGLRTLLENVSDEHPGIAVIKVRLRDYVPTPNDPDVVLITSRIVHCGPVTDNMKVLIKGTLLGRQVRVQPGNHSVLIDDGRECPSHVADELFYAHYPTRSAYQWISKSVIGWAKIVASGPKMIKTRHSYHYHGPYEYLKNSPAVILRNANFMAMQSNRTDLINDPITYRGDALKHTPAVDYEMRCVHVLMKYIDDLATQHGEMLEWMHERTSLLPSKSTGYTKIL